MCDLTQKIIIAFTILRNWKKTTANGISIKANKKFKYVLIKMT
jgi:hypothetical protein